MHCTLQQIQMLPLGYPSSSQEELFQQDRISANQTLPINIRAVSKPIYSIFKFYTLEVIIILTFMEALLAF